MKQFNQDFKTELYKTISDIENNSLVEIVSIVKKHSDTYPDIPLIISAIITLVVYSLLMFVNFQFTDYLFFFVPILTFILMAAVFTKFKKLNKLFIGKERQKKAVEIMARAVFQKGGIHNTNSKIGILFYISVFEKMVYILPDKGAETSVPLEEWDKIRNNFSSIFLKKNYAFAFIEELQKCKTVFNQYVPPIENDINELPDDLNVEL